MLFSMILENFEPNSLEIQKNSFYSFFEEFENNFIPPYEGKNIPSLVQKIQEIAKSTVIKSTVVHQELKAFLTQFSLYKSEEPLSDKNIGDIKNITALILVALATNQ